MKYKCLICILAFQALVVLLYFSKFPIFPQFPSVDFESHVRIATDYARNLPALPSLSQLLLYGGIELYLAVFIRLFPSIEPLIVTRWAMAFLVVLSPLVVYSTAKILFVKEKIALLSTAVWSSGFVWFGMVFNSGLYANFLGVLSSFFLVTAIVRFVKGKLSLLNITLLSSSLVLTFFSHYSVLLVFPALILMCVYQLVHGCTHHDHDKKQQLNWVILLCSLVLPLVVGYLVFPNVITTLLGFRNAGGPTVVPSTFLSDAIPLPVLASMVSIIAPGNPIRNDGTAIAVFVSLALFVRATLKNEGRISDNNFPFSFLTIWFLSTIAVSPVNSIAWRFAFAALIPLPFMVGYGFYSLISGLDLPKKVERRWGKTRLPARNLFLFVILTSIILMSSWSMSSLLDSTEDTRAYSTFQHEEYQILTWLKQNPPSPRHPNVIYDNVVSGPHAGGDFDYAEIMGIRAIYAGYQPAARDVLLAASYYNASYVITADLTVRELPRYVVATVSNKDENVLIQLLNNATKDAQTRYPDMSLQATPILYRPDLKLYTANLTGFIFPWNVITEQAINAKVVFRTGHIRIFQLNYQ